MLTLSTTIGRVADRPRVQNHTTAVFDELSRLYGQYVTTRPEPNTWHVVVFAVERPDHEPQHAEVVMRVKVDSDLISLSITDHTDMYEPVSLERILIDLVDSVAYIDVYLAENPQHQHHNPSTRLIAKTRHVQVVKEQEPDTA